MSSLRWKRSCLTEEERKKWKNLSVYVIMPKRGNDIYFAHISQIEKNLITDRLVQSWTYPLIQAKLLEETSSISKIGEKMKKRNYTVKSNCPKWIKVCGIIVLIIIALATSCAFLIYYLIYGSTTVIK